MKKRLFALCMFLVLICISTLAGCSENNVTTSNSSTTFYDEPQSVEHESQSVEPVGEASTGFKEVIENNLFRDIAAFDGRLLKGEVLSKDEDNKIVTQMVRMMDLYGNDLAEYRCSSNDAYHVTTLTATDDGGFLFVLGFSDYAYDQNTWASDKGFASRVIKCDKDGNLQFDVAFDGIEGRALKYCYEKVGQFYFFGTVETPETKRRGVGSPSDIFMAVLDENGAILKVHCVAGSDFDNLESAEISDGGFLLSIRSQSDDGDFAGSNSKGYPVNWVVKVSDSLEITEKKKESGRDYFDYRLGEKDGVPVYKSDALLKDFDAGFPETFIDYGDFYLIVSENNTGIYENTPPMVSAIWYYTETVYSAYTYDGELLFRKSVDSSPDFDAIIQKAVAQ